MDKQLVTERGRIAYQLPRLLRYIDCGLIAWLLHQHSIHVFRCSGCVHHFLFSLTNCNLFCCFAIASSFLPRHFCHFGSAFLCSLSFQHRSCSFVCLKKFKSKRDEENHFFHIRIFRFNIFFIAHNVRCIFNASALSIPFRHWQQNFKTSAWIMVVGVYLYEMSVAVTL